MSVESSFLLLWLCITALRNWLKKLAPLSQPIRSKTRTNRDSLAHASFPAFRVIASSFDWTMDCSASFVIGQSNYFGFGFRKLN